jgi:hypothetical protein
MPADTLTILRRGVLSVLGLGLTGVGVELLLIQHYEEPWQLAPLVLVAVSLAAIVWHAAGRSRASVQGLQAAMLLCLAGGLAGVALHFRGAAEFQLEIDPSISGTALVRKVMRAKAPPVIAPGVMVQLGLLGLVYAHHWSPRHE